MRQNSKSEYLQLLDYINKNNKGNIRIKKKKKSIIKNKIEKIDIDSRLRSFFNIGNIQTEDIFRKFVCDIIRSEIIDEKQFEKSFFLCSEVVDCHRKIFYDYTGYECNITDDDLFIHIRYLMKTNFRNILLEICNFENNQIIINYKNKIKDIIPAIQNNIMIDFNCYDIMNTDIYLLKAIIYNNSKEFDDKIKFIKIISFGDSFDDISLTELEIHHNDDTILEQLNILRNRLNIRNIPDKTSDLDKCIGCFYKKFCSEKNIQINKKKEKIKKITIVEKKQPVKLRNTFLL